MLPPVRPSATPTPFSRKKAKRIARNLATSRRMARPQTTPATSAPITAAFTPYTPDTTTTTGGQQMPTTNLVPTRLQSGDELHTVRKPAHSLQTLYKVPWQTIVQWQGWPLTKEGIDAGVMATGGKRLPFEPDNPYDAQRKLGWAVFTSSSVIKLPAGGPRPPATAPKKKSAGGAIAFLGLAGLVAAVALSD